MMLHQNHNAILCHVSTWPVASCVSAALRGVVSSAGSVDFNGGDTELPGPDIR